MVAAYQSTPLDDALAPPLALVPEPVIGPQDLPGWYVKPAKPKLADVLAAAERERSDHEPRIEQGYEMLRRINRDQYLVGIFERDAKKVLSGEVERGPDPSLRVETARFCAFIAQMDWQAEALYRQSIDKEEAAAKEDAIVYLQECRQRQHAEEGGGDYKSDKAFLLATFGLTAEFVGIDPDNAECGLSMRLLDPATVFPIWEGGRGLAQVYRKYEATAGEVIGNYGHLMSKAAVSRIKAAAKEAGERDYNPNYQGEIVEYYDRNWFFVAWDEKEVVCIEHGYAEVPLIVTPGNFGGAGMMTTPHTWRYANGSYWHADRGEDLKRLYQPFLQGRVPEHEIKEAVYGQILTAVRKMKNPAKNVRADILQMEEGKPELSNDEGAVNMVSAETEIEDNEGPPNPTLLQTAMAFLAQHDAMTIPSSLLAGNAPMSQGSGTALNLLGRQGLETWSPLVVILERSEERYWERCLKLWRDWGSILGMEGERGVLYVPRNRPVPNARTGQSTAHEVTPELLRRTGIRVAVKFQRFNPDQLPMLSQGVIMAMSGGLIPKREAIKILGYTADPDAAIEQIRNDMLEEVPAIAMQRQIAAITDNIRAAGERGDDESLEQEFLDGFFVVNQLEIERIKQEVQLAESRRLKLMASLMGPGVQGLSMPDFGIQPGTQGGRPQGSMPGQPVPATTALPPAAMLG